MLFKVFSVLDNVSRFVYVNNATGSLKLDKNVDFDVNSLDLTPFLSGPLQADSRPVFNLYGCVCHFGSVGGGHYTAYSRHLATGGWNYFDDGSISEGKIPGETPGDQSSAYILFYQREGDYFLILLGKKFFMCYSQLRIPLSCWSQGQSAF